MNCVIRIADNRRRSLDACTEEERRDLQLIAGIRLSDKESAQLLVFPKNFKQTEDKLSERTICRIENGELVTGNIMGFVGVNGTQLAISSRFEESGGDFFMHYMLQRVMSLNVFDLKHSSEQDEAFDFLVYLFPRLLLDAYRQGIYKTYVRRQYNDAKLKGVIDVPRHIRQNPMPNGKIAYNTREYSYDNSVTQLLRHTIEHIRTHRYASQILRSDKTVRGAVAEFVAVTPSYNRQQRQRVIGENLRRVQHPYFTAYVPLQKLCLAILRHDELKYGYKQDEVYGILFDGAWLWEEYLNTLLSKLGYQNPKNKIGYGRKDLFKDNSQYFCYPDFWREKTIIDAKYKRVEKEENGKLREKVSNEDLYQIISYLHIMDAEETGIIYPRSREQEFVCERHDIGALRGMGGKAFTIAFPIPQQAGDMGEFVKRMKKVEEEVIGNR